MRTPENGERDGGTGSRKRGTNAYAKRKTKIVRKETETRRRWYQKNE